MQRWRKPEADRPERPRDELGSLLSEVGRGSDERFARLYDVAVGRVYGLALRLVRDPAQAEEVTQEVFVEVWRTAARFDPAKGSAASWILTLTHQRAVDRIRSADAAAARDHRWAVTEPPDYDQVTEEVTGRLERRQVRRCLEGLTELQREAITLAYYGGRTYREVAESLDLTLPTVKTRMRDGLIRLRDCLGVTR